MPPLFYVPQVSPYSDGPAGVHGVLGQAGTAISELAGLVGLDAEVVSDVAALTPARLQAEGAVLVLYTIGETPWSAEQRAAIEEALGAGRLGVVGLHSATDSCRRWEAYGSLMGARFAGHPWTSSFDIEIVDRSHPATTGLPDPWPWHDEVYLFAGLRPDARVLLRVADGQLDESVAPLPAQGLPLAWCHQVGAGKVFYTSLGHFPGAWENPTYLRHVGGGLSWVIG